MKRTNFKNITLPLLGMGSMRLPQSGVDPDLDKTQEIVDYCFSQGVNYFDTAYFYHGGKSEVIMGKALAKYPRDSFYVADKYHFSSEPDYKKQFEEQLKRLNMDRIDFYMLHSIMDTTVDEYMTNGCIEYFLEQQEKGRITYLGFSLHGGLATLDTIIKKRSWDFALIQLNYYDWYHSKAKDEYDMLVEANIPVMIMEPVHGGLLTSLTDESNKVLKNAEPDKSIASWAFRFVAGLPGVAVILTGMSTMEQARENIATIKENKPLSETDHKTLKEACILYNKTVGVTCTSCGYCLDDCPLGLDIPMMLNYYNDSKSGGDWRLSQLSVLPDESQPKACTACGLCVGHCPQDIDIPKYLTEMAGKI